MQQKQPLFRFAPSPNGPLHLGHAYSALLNWHYAAKFGGTALLRIEDIDKGRTREAHVAAIYRDLHWLGLDWPEPVRRQSSHLSDYKSYLQQLLAAGLLYPCFASRAEIRAAADPKSKDPDGAPLYPGLYKNLSEAEQKALISAGKPYALRLHMEKAIARAEALSGSPLTYQSYDEGGTLTTTPINAARWGDVIIARKDIATSYHLAVTADDHLTGITHICRGQDLLAATDIHRILQINLGLDEPLYHHHELLQFGDEKLSKSRNHPGLYQLREKGVTASRLRAAFKAGPKAMAALL